MIGFEITRRRVVNPEVVQIIFESFAWVPFLWWWRDRIIRRISEHKSSSSLL